MVEETKSFANLRTKARNEGAVTHYVCSRVRRARKLLQRLQLTRDVNRGDYDYALFRRVNSFLFYLVQRH